MIKKEKCVEYYFDSKKYDKSQILENMRIEQIGFEKKEANISITLNEYGIYIVKLSFFNNKLPIINRKVIKNTEDKKNSKVKIRKTYKGYETYNESNKIYGQYKTTKTFQPI